jgi:hypothetical protein
MTTRRDRRATACATQPLFHIRMIEKSHMAILQIEETSDWFLRRVPPARRAHWRVSPSW